MRNPPRSLVVAALLIAGVVGGHAAQPQVAIGAEGNRTDAARQPALRQPAGRGQAQHGYVWGRSRP